MDHSRFTDKEKAEIELIVFSAMDTYFQQKGKKGTQVLLMTAAIVGAVTVILGGAKVFLAWLGFSYMK